TQRFAERLGSGQDVIGRRIGAPGADAEIVGLAADAKYVAVTGETEPQAFFPRAQAGSSFGSGSAAFYVRGAQPPEVLMSAVRETVARVDPLVPITDLRTMRQQVGENLERERFVVRRSARAASARVADRSDGGAAVRVKGARPKEPPIRCGGAPPFAA